MLLAAVYSCLRFLLDLILIRLPYAERDAEVLLLRHELSVLRRSTKKPRLQTSDPMILSALAMRLPRSTWNALIVRPETVKGGKSRSGSSPTVVRLALICSRAGCRTAKVDQDDSAFLMLSASG